MDLVERYLQQVRRFLPARDQDDIVNELRDDILSEVADQEAHLGRPVTETEMVNLLKHRGHPFLLAQQYRPKQYLLIGPGMLPFYWQTLKASLALAFLVIVIVTAVSAVQGAPPHELWNRLSGFFTVAIYIFAWVTGLFAVLDVVQGRMNLQQGWDPRKLPALAKRPHPVPRGLEVFTELISTGVFLIWWLAVPHYPWVMLGPAANVIMFTPAWHHLYWLITAPLIISFGMQVIALVRPEWRWVGRSRRFVAAALTIVALLLLLGAGDLVMATGTVPIEARALAMLNRLVTVGLSFTVLGVTVQAAVEGFRMVRGKIGGSTGRSRAGSETSGS
jgi:hypothetical protein